MQQMIGAPARTAEDALAAVDWLCREGQFDAEVVNIVEDHKPPLVERVSWSLLAAVRDYLAATTGRLT